MAAIPSKGDQNSIVVRVPVPTPVGSATAAPRPVTPPATTANSKRSAPTFILPDSSPSVQVQKLARLVDVSHFAGGLNDLYRQHYRHESTRQERDESPVFAEDRALNSYYSDPAHQILADYLADHGDPREDVVRGMMRYGPAMHEAWIRAGGKVEQTPYGAPLRPRTQEYPRFHSTTPPITLSDGTNLYFDKHSRGKEGQEPVWAISWSGPAGRRYNTVMGHQKFKDWLRRFDRDELSRIVKGMRDGR